MTIDIKNKHKIVGYALFAILIVMAMILSLAWAFPFGLFFGGAALLVIGNTVYPGDRLWYQLGASFVISGGIFFILLKGISISAIILIVFGSWLLYKTGWRGQKAGGQG
jgi:amino acid transporter